jgi:hypothetical protein
VVQITVRKRRFYEYGKNNVPALHRYVEYFDIFDFVDACLTHSVDDVDDDLCHAR